MLTYPMEERGSLPLYEYLCRRIRADILSGALPAGTRLPSKRALAEHLRVSVVTVEGAYSQLEAEGYLQARPKRGFFVSAVEQAPPPAVRSVLMPETPAVSWRLDLGRNQVDTARFPVSTWARLTRQVLSEAPEALLSPVPHQGLAALRQAIADDLRDFKGMAVSPEQIVIGAGAEYLYLLLAQLLGRDTMFAVEDPGYPKIRQVYDACGAVCAPIPLDNQGVELAALMRSKARALHISPNHQYPTGLVTPIARRQALLRWAEDTGSTIIEDDYDSEFRYTGRPIPTLQSIDDRGRVIYLNPLCVLAFWCCRPGCWNATGRSWASMPVRSLRWSSTFWPVSSPGATTSVTSPGCGRNIGTAAPPPSAPSGLRRWPAMSPFPRRGPVCTFCCGWIPTAPMKNCAA